ncbi:MAG TPA: YfiR family protein [Holophaga sp.]|nr:YfiR family protein [Holophaga sp.]
MVARALRGVWALVCLVLLLGASSARVEAPAEEYAAKAQFLVDMAVYFRWPEGREAKGPFVVAVLGRSPFGARLDALVRARTHQGRPMKVAYAARLADLGPCDMVFICRSERRNGAEILEWAKGRGLLTVAEDRELVDRGAMVGLILDAERLRMHLNLKALEGEGMGASAQLMRLAVIAP